MILTKKQENGINIACERFKNKEKYTCIAGYAGTGKSTIVNIIIASLGVDINNVIYCAYTGKASLVLKRKGCKNVSTLHKLLYKSFPDGHGGFRNIKKFSIGYDIVVVDEISMVPKEILDLLFSHNVHIICLGDPYQLPPPKGLDNNILKNPHIFLDEIMRQEENNEIIKISMDIRNGKELDIFKGENVQILDVNDFDSGMLLWADQILCATNKTRMTINDQVRQLIGRKSNEPENGDKIICQNNYWEVLSSNGTPLTNGTIGEIKNYSKKYNYVLQDYILESNLKILDEDEEDEHFNNINISYKNLVFEEPTKNFKLANRIKLLNFNYGYAITTHKSQGSEWDKVLIIEEKFPFSKEDHSRWLYTAITRASKKVIIIKK